MEDNLKATPTNYYITGPYPDEGWSTKNGFLKAVEQKKFKNICQLMLAGSTYSFSFQNGLLNDKTPKDKGYQSILFYIDEKMCDYEKMEYFYNQLVDICPPHYAIIFKLPTNYMPLTESKIKNGFFGYSVAKHPKESVWRQHIDKVDTAILKDIYPINFINDAVLKSDAFQQNILSGKIGAVTNTTGKLYKWKLTPEEISIAREKLSGCLLPTSFAAN